MEKDGPQIDELLTETGSTYRDKVATIGTKGKRQWVYPQKPKGKWHRARAVVAIFLLAALVISPFIKVNGQPVILMDIINRKFILFSVVFWPQDFHIFAISLIALIFFIVAFTLVYGRLWCGWACPQTIFMEMVFRKIEYFIEGGPSKQKALKKMPWTLEKIFKKGAKHFIFFFLSFLTGNLLLAYIIGSDELFRVITGPVSEHYTGLAFMLLFSGVFYFIFSWFREQACTMLCPYGRLQGVLLDRNSIIVSYDFVRGEERVPLKKATETSGDCIDCGNCVNVCPTGIDIRNGTQLECINCTACMDACDTVMEKVGREKKLIKYASYNQIESKSGIKFTPKMIFLNIAMIALATLITLLIVTRSDYDAKILKAKGTRYQITDDELILNVYKLKFINKTFSPLDLEMKVRGSDAVIQLIGAENLKVPANGLTETNFMIEMNLSEISETRNDIIVDIYNKGELIEEEKVIFAGPGRLYKDKLNKEKQLKNK